jgi:hypothetical protein
MLLREMLRETDVINYSTVQMLDNKECSIQMDE